MVNQRGEAPMATRKFVIAGIIIALLIGVTAVFFASGDPDGLESTALVVQGQKTLTGGTPENAEIHEDMAGKFSYSSLMPDYSLNESLGPWGGIIAIMAGTILAFIAVLGCMKLVKVFLRPKEEQIEQ
jgi:cobalt/nickel transport protein